MSCTSLRARTLLCLSFASARLLAPPVYAAGQEKEQLPQPIPFSGYHTPLQDHRLVGAFWRGDHTFESVLTIRNVVETAPVTVTPVLVLADGTSHALQSITLQPAAVASINLNRALSALALPASQSALTFGTVGLNYSWHWDGAVTGEVQIVDSDRSLSYSSGLRNEPQEGTVQKQTIEGVWWRRSATSGGYLRLTDVAAEPINVIVNFFGDSSSTAVSRTETLRPGETKMVELGALLDSVSGAPTQGGLNISFSGVARALALDGGLEDTASGFSTRLVLGSIKKINEIAKVPAASPVILASVGMMIGRPGADMMFPRPLTFHPYLVLRNAATVAKTVSVSANYMFGTAAITAHLLDVTLAAGATRTIDADAAIQALHLNPLIGYVNLVYSFVGDKSDILVSAGSVDGTGTYVFETPAAATMHSMSRTICHWQLGDGIDTMFTIWNHGAAPEDLLLTLNYDGGEYSKPIHLEAKASVMLSIEDLVARGEPDVKGRFLPGILTEGSAKVSGTGGELEHINAAVAVASYNVNKATCTVHCINCAETTYTTFYYDSSNVFQLDEGSTKQATAIAQTRSGGTYNVTSAVTWSSSNTNMFTVGTGSSIPGMVAAFTPGQGTLTFESLPVQNVGVACGDPPICDEADTMEVTRDAEVDDTTPIITGIDPSDWTAGTTTPNVTFTGQYFGTNTPTLMFSPAAGISYALLSNSDTQIVANITVASGTPNEDVQVSVTSNGYAGNSFTSGSGASPTSSPTNASVHSPMNTPEITVIGWVDSSAPDLAGLQQNGASNTLVSDLNSKTTCVIDIVAWAFAGLALDLSGSQADRDYANTFLVLHSANPDPGPVVSSVTAQYNAGKYRLFNDWGNSLGSHNVGITPDPCNFLGSTVNGWVAAGQESSNMGMTATSGSGSNLHTFQVAEGRIGTRGQKGSMTINQGRTVPWIYSVIEFDTFGNPIYSDNSTFPTFSVYKSGQRIAIFPQSSVKAFVNGYDQSNENNWNPVP